MDKMHIGSLMGVGAAASLGTLLASKEKITFRLFLARTITGAALGTSGTLIKVIAPNAPDYVQFGAASALAIMGVTGIELLLRGVFKRWRR